MKRTVAYLTLVVLGIFTFSFLLNTVSASSISVGTYDAISGLPKDNFAHLEDVRIIAQSSHKPITIRILDPYDVEVYVETVDSYTYDKTISGITTESGLYTVEASSPMTITKKNFATVFFNVMPETPLGTSSIALVSLGALGTYGFIKRRKHNMPNPR
jgi:hypothetical protein